MRSLELHFFEAQRDVDLALQSGTANPEQLASTRCQECEDQAGYSAHGSFTPFVLVIDENDQDWILCEDCASPVLSYVDAYFPPVVYSKFQNILMDSNEEDLEHF